ncbi:unnamed protein product [Phytomonas sp. Hart1]|nr:unnamed protein product [Phytomonas sp. Hart1]|eukprot:CCW71180.1 unnamed protein product [Phytomonas sp. isolate Hart1]
MEAVLYADPNPPAHANPANLTPEGLDARGALSCLAVAKLCAMATIGRLHPLALPALHFLRGIVDYEPATALAEVGALAVALSEFFHQPNLFMEEVLSLLALLQTNEFFLPESGGIALFPSLSFLNHSCEPNCAVVQGDGPLQRRLISLRDIRDGEQLFIDYNSHLTSTLDYEHRKALCAQRHFECFCAKCIRRI